MIFVCGFMFLTAGEHLSSQISLKLIYRIARKKTSKEIFKYGDLTLKWVVLILQ